MDPCLWKINNAFKGLGFLREVAVMLMNAIVVLSFIGVFVGKCYYYSKYSHKR